MEERVTLPFMTADEEEVYRRYYGEHNLPPRQSVPVQYPSIRRPSYPPAQIPNVQDNLHYGETMSEMIGSLGLAYVSTPNIDPQRKAHLPLRPPSPNTIMLPDHVQPSNDGGSNVKEVYVEQNFCNQSPPNNMILPNHVRISTQPESCTLPQRPASPNMFTIPGHVRLSHDEYSGPRPIFKEPEPELVTFKQRLMGRTKYASRGSKPSTARHLLRTVQFLSAALVLILAILTNLDFPPSLSNRSTVIYFYAVAIIDLVLFVFYTVDYCQRRFSYRAKLWRIVPLLLDALMTILWICGTLPLLVQFSPCPIGGYGGWCDRHNSLLAFAVVSSSLALLNLTWDFFGTCLESRPPPKPKA